MNQFPDDPSGTNSPLQPPSEESRSKWFTRKMYTSPAEKKRDFWLGVGLFFVLNIVLVLCQWGAAFALIAIQPDIYSSPSFSTNLYSIFSMLLTILPWVINFGLIIYFALTRSQIALGMVAGFGIALAIVICLGVIFTVWCFVALGSGGY